MADTNRLVIIGSGAAGWTAAVYAARAGLEPLVLTGLQEGGQMTIAGDVENYPGFEDGIDGPLLMERMAKQAARFGARVIADTVTGVDFSGPVHVLRGELDEYEAEAVIVATGATARWLGVPGEERYRGRGVSACATCDGYFFRGRDVIVVGGGNTAAEEALHLSAICRTVHIVHRRNGLRAERILRERLARRTNVVYHWDTVVSSIHGGEGQMDPMTHAVTAPFGGGKDSVIGADGLFVAIGHDPATESFRGHLELDGGGYVAVDPGTAFTSVPGVFAAGDVADPHYRQAITAAGMGCMAALDAERYLAERA